MSSIAVFDSGGYDVNPQSGVNLGSAYGEITIGDNIDRALGNATRGFDNALSRIGNSLSSLGNTMTSVGGTLTVAMAPLEGFFIDGIRNASAYEDALKEIEVRAGLTAEELTAVNEKTTELAMSSQYGPTELADAFLQLLTSGSSLEEAMLQIDAVVQGASASGEELGYTADALTDIMAAFGLEASNSTEVMQALIAASGASSATFSDLIQGFANIGPMAANFGLSVQDTAAALAVFSENGIKGAEAGTQLRSMLTNMTRTTDDVVGMWNNLGVELYDTQGNMRDLDDIIKDLNDSMEGMSDQERNNVIVTLAGSYGQLGLSALLAADGIDDMSASMAEQANMEDIASSRLDTFSGAISFLQGSLQLLQITGLQPLIDEYLTPLIKKVADVVNMITEWMVANPQLAGQIVEVLAVLSLLGPVLVAGGLALNVIGMAISGVGALLGLLLSPIGLVIAAVAALTTAFVMDFGGIRTALQPTIDWITTIATNAFMGFINLLAGMWTTVQPALTALSLWFTNSIGPAIVEILNNSVLPLLQRLVLWLNELWYLTQPQLQALYDWFMTTGLNVVMAYISDTVLTGIQDFINILTRLWTDVAPYLTSLYGWFVTDALPGVISFLQNDIWPVFESFGGLLSDIWTLASPYLEQFYNWFMLTGLPVIKNFIEGPFTAGINTVIGVLQNFLGWVTDAINGAREFLGVGVTGEYQANAGAFANANGGSPSANSPIVSGSGAFGGSRDSGGRGYEGVSYLIGTGAQPEMYIPDSPGTFIPNADQLGSKQFNITIESITAATMAEARDLGNAFGDAFMGKLRNSGFAEDF